MVVSGGIPKSLKNINNNLIMNELKNIEIR